MRAFSAAVLVIAAGAAFHVLGVILALAVFAAGGDTMVAGGLIVGFTLLGNLMAGVVVYLMTKER